MTLDIRWTTRDDVVARLSAHLRLDPDHDGCSSLLRVLSPHHVDAAFVGTLRRSRSHSIEDLEHTLTVALERRAHASPRIVQAPLATRLLWPLLFWPAAASLRERLLAHNFDVVGDEAWCIWRGGDPLAATSWALDADDELKLPPSARAARLLAKTPSTSMTRSALAKTSPAVLRRAACEVAIANADVAAALADELHAAANDPDDDPCDGTDVDVDAAAALLGVDATRRWAIDRLARLALAPGSVLRACRAAARLANVTDAEMPVKHFCSVEQWALRIARGSQTDLDDGLRLVLEKPLYACSFILA